MLYVESEWLKMLPPVLAIVSAILSKRAIPSLCLGIFSGALLMAGGGPLQSLQHCGSFFQSVFWEQGVGLKFDSLALLLFLWALGMLGDMMEKSGSIRSLAVRLESKCSSKIKAQLLVFVMGIVVFIDDFFNSIIVGAISKKLVDKRGVSREKLAYILDSTAGPVCMLAPISSWGASIIVTLGAIVHQYPTAYSSGFGLFLDSIPYNFYAWMTLAFLVLTVGMKFDFARMRQAEQQAELQIHTGERKHGVAVQGSERGLLGAVVPLVVLTLATVGAMLITGLPQDWYIHFSVIAALENSQIGVSLLLGAAIGICSALPW
ncbi:MAG: hypothetical protein OXT67_02680, partial [Zetaproteobacteria bacterium]|nr:hypothetical protein [Zetaproteobacteria bacterium]